MDDDDDDDDDNDKDDIFFFSLLDDDLFFFFFDNHLISQLNRVLNRKILSKQCCCYVSNFVLSPSLTIVFNNRLKHLSLQHLFAHVSLALSTLQQGPVPTPLLTPHPSLR